MNKNRIWLIFDLDGVFTNGKFLYDINGKQYKEFGADDSDGLKLLKNYFKDRIKINIITSDERGFDISHRRIDDIGFDLNLVRSGKERLEWINKSKKEFKDVYYVGDGFSDLGIVYSGIKVFAPANANQFLLNECYKKLHCNGGERAVLEVAIELIKIQNRKLTIRNIYEKYL